MPSCFSEEIYQITVVAGNISIKYIFATDFIIKKHPKVEKGMNGNQGCYIYIGAAI